MNRITLVILILVNTLFANTLNEGDLKVLKELDMEPSFISNKILQDTFYEYTSSYNISYYNNFIKKSSLNAQIVRTEIEKENLPEAAFFIPMIESHFVNQTRGKNAPAGLWQIIPETATSLKLRNDEFIDERLDLIKSTDAASSYLKKYHSKFNKWYLALLAYNCGEGRVLEGVARASLDRYLELNPNMSGNANIRSYKNSINEYQRTKRGFSDLYEIYNKIGKQQSAYSFEYLVKNNKERDYLPDSSVLYIKKLIVFSMISNRNLFKSINNKSKYKLEKVKANKGLQLNSIANAIGMDYNEFKSINKHIKKDVIPSDSKVYSVYIPSEKMDIYNQRMAGIKQPLSQPIVDIKDNKNKEVKVIKENKVVIKEKDKKVVESKKNINKPIIHIVKKGDSFESIAKKYKVDIKKLKALNNKKSNLINIGDKIEIYR